MQILGIDIGGSGVKASIVNTETGEILSERQREPTPQPADVKAIQKTVLKIVDSFKWKGSIGAGFPAVVQNGIVRTASNIDKNWIGIDVQTLLSETVGSSVFVLNDADAAGLAEITFGTGKEKKGVVVMITVGTGIGSSFFIDGKLFPNTEFGQFLLNGKIAEKYAADVVRKKLNLSWKKWGKRFNKYLKHLESLIWPDLIILGGGVSKKFDKFKNDITIETEIVPALLQNNAGIIGAAMAARNNTIGK
jgi:polyphosphate glucokinase